MSQRRAVYFPPRILSDLVLHYRDVDFHLHKLVLYQQCDYFRAFVLTLQPAAASAMASAAASGFASASAGASRAAEQPASSSASSSSSSLSTVAAASSRSTRPAAKRARSSEPIGSQPAADAGIVESECVHSPPVACVQLPDSIGVLPCTTTDELQLFLEHVYFPCSHPFPPYISKVRVDLSTIESDAALPLFPTPDAAAIRQYASRIADVSDDAGGHLISPALLSLIHYFHAERLWQQSLAVVKTMSANGTQAWFWLSILARYGLKEEEDRLIQAAAKHRCVCDNALYREYAASFSPSLTLRLMLAMRETKK